MAPALPPEPASIQVVGTDDGRDAHALRHDPGTLLAKEVRPLKHVADAQPPLDTYAQLQALHFRFEATFRLNSL